MIRSTQAVRAPRFKLLAAAAAALAIIAVLTSWGWWKSTRPVEHVLRPLVQLDVDLGPEVSLGSLYGAAAILSPDGTRLVYVSQGRSLPGGSISPTPLSLQERRVPTSLFLTDGQWVAFFSTGKLQKISVDGGSAITLCSANNARGGVGARWQHHIGAQQRGRPIADSFRRRSANTRGRLQSGDFSTAGANLAGGRPCCSRLGQRGASFDAANIDVISLGGSPHQDTRAERHVRRYLPADI